MKTITIDNHKGGCAKTTTALNIAVALAAKGARVLAVDLDLQGNLSAALGADLAELEGSRRTVHRLMLDPAADFSEFLIHSRPRLDLLPASLDSDVKPALDALVVSRELGRGQRFAGKWAICSHLRRLAPAQPLTNHLSEFPIGFFQVEGFRVE